MAPAARPDLYISADVETDGPIPGEFSMLSFALSVAATYDGHSLRSHGDEHRLLYVELKPISERFEPEALAVNGLDRDRLARDGAEPQKAMNLAARWVSEEAQDARPVLVAYPMAFDWAFLYWYFIRFTGASPFGFSSCLDIRTFYQARILAVHDRASQEFMPQWLLPRREHTHHAAEDAVEQAELFVNIFTWALAGGGCNETTAKHDPPTPRWLLPLISPIRRPRDRGSVPFGRFGTRLSRLLGTD